VWCQLDSHRLAARRPPQLGGYAPKKHASWRHLSASRLTSKACPLGSRGRTGRKGALLGDWRLQVVVTWWRLLLGVGVSRGTPVHSCLLTDYKCNRCGRRWATDLVKEMRTIEKMHPLAKGMPPHMNVRGGPLPFPPINARYPLCFEGHVVLEKSESCLVTIQRNCLVIFKVL